MTGRQVASDFLSSKGDGSSLSRRLFFMFVPQKYVEILVEMRFIIYLCIHEAI